MCKIVFFFIHQLHLMLLLLNVTCVIASDHFSPLTFNNKNQLLKQQIDASKNASSKATDQFSNSIQTATGSNDDKQLNFFNKTSILDMQTNLDHLNELNNNLIYTDQYVVELKGGPNLAKELSEKHGFVYLGQIFEDHYHLKHRRLAKRSIEPAHYDLHRTFINEPNVNSIQQQTLKKRVKRDFLPIKPYTISNHHSKPPSQNSNSRFNDPQWPHMWYLSNANRGLDMNVQKVWSMNITGKGVVVTILDDGLEKDHPDIAANYDEKASFDVNNLDDDPQPRYDMLDSNRHGTRCAGEVAAVANNNFCGVGIAYDSKIGGVRMLDGDVTDAVEARSLGLQNQHIDIYSASWGPDDDVSKTVDGPGELATRAFIEGVTKGRGGLGSIFIWASGNGGREHDNCNCDGYTNSIWTLSISSATENALVPWYSESCSSTLATTYSSGAYGEKQIITTDLHHRCTTTHTGTSASAPLAAGIVALCLEANPRLTWRDMQHLVVHTANPGNLQANDWRINGVGRKVSHSFGYGLLDAKAMVDLSKEWVTVPPQKICETRSNPIDKSIPFKSYVELSLEVHCDKVKYLEHVQARLNLTTNRRGDIHIYLISPSGTRATLVAERPMDNSRAGFVNWPFMSVHSWGEQPEGKWKLEIHNEGKYHNRAQLKEWTLVMYGTSENPDRRKKSNNNNNIATNSRTFNTIINKIENNRLPNNGRLDNTVLNEFKLSSLNKTKVNSVYKQPTLSKSNDLLNERLFGDSNKNISKTQLNNGHQLNVVSNDLGILNQPEIEPPHSSSNNQPTDQEELFGTNDIDKSTRAEKSGGLERKPDNQSKDQLSRLGNRYNIVKQEQSIDLIKSDGRSSLLLGDEHQAAENSALNQNRIAYGCSPNNFYFHGLCVQRCPDSYYGKELVTNLDSLMTPINNQDQLSVQLVNNNNRIRRLNFDQQLGLDQVKQFKKLKGMKESIEFKDKSNEHLLTNNDHTTSSILNDNLLNQTNSINSINSNDNSTTNKLSTISSINNVSSSIASTLSPLSITTASSLSSNQQQSQTTLSPSSQFITNDQIPFFELPYISHITIKQKDLNKNTLLRQQELTESFFNLDNSLYQQLVKESEDGLQQNELNSDKQQSNDERLEKISICLKCHYTCKKCKGHRSTDCIDCFSDSQLDSTGRCLFIDVIKNLNKLNQSSVWSASTMISSFDPRVQNWITIFSLILCLFFSIGFFYLLCRRDFKHKSSTIESTKSRKLANHKNLTDYNHQVKQLPNDELIHLNNDHNSINLSSNKHNSSINEQSFFIPLLRFFKSKNSVSSAPKSNQNKLNHNLNNIKYNNLSVKLEDVITDNEHNLNNYHLKNNEIN